MYSPKYAQFLSSLITGFYVSESDLGLKGLIYVRTNFENYNFNIEINYTLIWLAERNKFLEKLFHVRPRL
jgi:hypothetical protein